MSGDAAAMQVYALQTALGVDVFLGFGHVTMPALFRVGTLGQTPRFLAPSLSDDCDVLFDGASGCVHLLYAKLHGRNPMDCGYSRVSTSIAAPSDGCATQPNVQTTQSLPSMTPLIGAGKHPDPLRSCIPLPSIPA